MRKVPEVLIHPNRMLFLVRIFLELCTKSGCIALSGRYSEVYMLPKSQIILAFRLPKFSFHSIWDLGFGIIWDLGFWQLVIWDLGYGIWDLGFNILNLGGTYRSIVLVIYMYQIEYI